MRWREKERESATHERVQCKKNILQWWRVTEAAEHTDIICVVVWLVNNNKSLVRSLFGPAIVVRSICIIQISIYIYNAFNVESCMSWYDDDSDDVDDDDGICKKEEKTTHNQ